MPRRLRRRPSPAMVVALLALFVALDGPATAARLIDGKSIRRNSITTGQIRNGTLGTQDVSAKARKSLTATPKNSISATHIRAGAVGAGALAPKSVDTSKLGDASVGTAALAPAAVTPSKIADGAIGTAAIADGGLQGTDVGDFFGSVVVDFTAFTLNDCQKAEIPSPTPTGNAQAQIADDVIMVTPAPGFSDLITVTGYPGVGNTLRIIACRVGTLSPSTSGDVIDPIATRFYYLGIDAP
jgi:hypothetical protein